jgi:hypothetical protein
MNELDKIENHEEIPFESKMIFIKEGFKVDFPKSSGINGKLTYFELEKYRSAAKKVYDSSEIGKYIERIEIVDNISDHGQTLIPSEDKELKITIQISSMQLGIVPSNGCIHEYSEEQCRKFSDTLAHELVHAKDIVNFCSKYGLKEYNSIFKVKNVMATIAYVTLTEYAACRETAEKYGSYDSIEVLSKLEYYINSIGYEIISTSENVKLVANHVRKINYVIATRCAFADASGDDKEHLSVYGSSVPSMVLKQYVELVRPLLNVHYKDKILNAEGYRELGSLMMSKLLASYGLKEEEANSIITNLQWE